jgi:glycerate 2-kinase
MKIVICPDSFKGSLSSAGAARAIQGGFKPVFPAARFILLPLADGGEGTVETLLSARGGRRCTARVHDPLGRPVAAGYAVLKDGTGVVEMAAASGLPLLKAAERNPCVTSTFGTGELILRLLEKGIRRVIIGIGGSATVDGGTGMAKALGVKFLTPRGTLLKEGGGFLARLDRIDAAGLDPRVKRTEFIVVSDVNNPLTGRIGAARIFGPQKGASPAMVKLLDRGLAHYAAVIRRQFGADIDRMPGAGAAGGLGAGLHFFLGARIVEGSRFIVKELGLRGLLRDADLLVTGEGKIDGQVKFGKAILAVIEEGRRARVPVVAFCGQATPEAAGLRKKGLTAVFPILQGPVALDEAMAHAAGHLQTTAGQVAQLIRQTRGR